MKGLAANELRAYLHTADFVAVKGGENEVRFIGPAVEIRTRPAAGQVARDYQVSLKLPIAISNASQFRIVHLSKAGEASMWMEDAGTSVDRNRTRVFSNTKQPGVYALVQVSGSETK